MVIPRVNFEQWETTHTWIFILKSEMRTRKPPTVFQRANNDFLRNADAFLTMQVTHTHTCVHTAVFSTPSHGPGRAHAVRL